MSRASHKIQPSINVEGNLIHFQRPKVMAILNLTPDSYWPANRGDKLDFIKRKLDQFIKEGADFIDIGAQSTRPGAVFISADEELSRLEAILPLIASEYKDQIFSIDTFYSSVASAAVENGFSIINDVSGARFDPGIAEVAAHFKVPFIMGHVFQAQDSLHSPNTSENWFIDLVKDSAKQMHMLYSKGVNDIIFDPCFGFGKNAQQNFYMLQNLEHFALLRCLVMVGISRKSMITKTLDITADDSLPATSALHIIALQKGAQLLRVHDVKEAKECIKLLELLEESADDEPK